MAIRAIRSTSCSKLTPTFAAALGSSAGALAVNTGGTLDLCGKSLTVAALNGGGTIDNGVLNAASISVTGADAAISE